jgi:hypothetical protein
MAPHGAREVQRADPRLRRRALAALAVIAVGGAVALVLLQGVLADLRQLRGNDFARARDALAALFLYSIAGSALLTTSVCVYLWRMANRIRDTLQFPPPGTRVIRDTIVLRGEQAARRGRLLQWLACLLVISVIGLLAAAWRLRALLGNPLSL